METTILGRRAKSNYETISRCTIFKFNWPEQWDLSEGFCTHDDDDSVDSNDDDDSHSTVPWMQLLSWNWSRHLELEELWSEKHSAASSTHCNKQLIVPQKLNYLKWHCFCHFRAQHNTPYFTWWNKTSLRN